jgi:hypothetical protein
MSTTWVYLRSEPGLWTVGFYRPDGRWEPDSDHGSTDEAAARARWLNGADDSTATAQELRRLADYHQPEDEADVKDYDDIEATERGCFRTMCNNLRLRANELDPAGAK